jgi:hypothetical protein
MQLICRPPSGSLDVAKRGRATGGDFMHQSRQKGWISTSTERMPSVFRISPLIREIGASNITLRVWQVQSRTSNAVQENANELDRTRDCCEP